ncbi:MAG: YkgJ family cysteine cluster protein [Candidatus Omnitrophota bacterium]
MKLYKELDREIERFKKVTGIRCVPGCGQCCASSKVETTILEMFPLALALWRKKEGEHWLKKAQDAGLSGPCVFYQPDSSLAGKGRCCVYAWRPLLCRLFGFSAVTNKYGRNVMLTCWVVKDFSRLEYEKTQKKIGEGLPVPRTSDFASRLWYIDFTLGVKQLPINKALAEALQRIAFSLDCSKGRI